MEKGFSIVVPVPVVVNTSKNVASEGLLCNHEGDWYKKCPEYNSVMCRQFCKWGPQGQISGEFNTEQGVIVKKMDDVDLDYSRKDEK